MAERQHRNEIDDLIATLASLQSEKIRLLEEKRQTGKDLQRNSSEIRAAEHRIAVLNGERIGGRPRGVFGKGTFSAAVHQVLAADEDRVWTPTQVAEAMGEARSRVTTALTRLADFNRIERVRRGQYRGRTTGRDMSPPHRLSKKEQVQRALELIEG